MTKLVMFDMDGTLVDSCADLASALNLMLADDGLSPLTVEDVAGLLGDGRHVFVRKALDLRGGEHVDLEDAMRRMGRYYDRYMVEKTALYEGMDTVLAQLKKAGVKMGVITNKQQSAARVIVRKLGLENAVDMTVGDDGVTPLKPAPDMLLNMMKHFGATPAESWMIGDNHTDIGAAKNAGVRSCFCDYGFGVLDGIAPDARVATAAEILKVILG
jgi:phosphoglycolate phosphatase